MSLWSGEAELELTDMIRSLVHKNDMQTSPAGNDHSGIIKAAIENLYIGSLNESCCYTSSKRIEMQQLPEWASCPIAQTHLNFKCSLRRTELTHSHCWMRACVQTESGSAVKHTGVVAVKS